MNYQQLAITEFGAPLVLALQERALPRPENGQVLVKVSYAGINPIDAKTRAGLGWAAQQNKDNLPWVPGYDIAGEVLACGEGAECWQAGDRVSGFIGFPLGGGGYSEYVVAEAASLTKVAPSIALSQAAALPLAGQTAWQALEKVGVKANKRVLILAGAGGVGHLAIQLAVAQGAQVIASCSPANIPFVTALGAEALDYYKAPLAEQLDSVDCLVDLMGGDVGIAALSCVKAGGKVVTIPTITAEAVIEQASLQGLQAEGMLVSPSVEQNKAMMAMIEAGSLNVHVAGEFPLSDGAKAHQQIESGHTRGKLILTMDRS
ncbi:NADP-dependent oxidoreductase [Photobacterium minamisatsumaniensis]|uniref:NADP-dependent oxidoreductase n=1 Tax=Photobacterium minamisatsumaniensis TaxID=2910233 RepID=UPI003D0A2013